LKHESTVIEESVVRQDDMQVRTAKPSGKQAKDMWDKLAAIGPVISGICVFAIGGYFTYVHNQEQLRIQEIETMEKFLPRLSGDEQSKRAAILAISSLTNAELAKRITAIYASNGPASTMQSLAQNSIEKNKSAAAATQGQLLEKPTLSKSRLKEIERNLKAAVDRQENSPDSQAQDLSYNLTKLADLYALEGEYDLAEPLLKSSLTLREKMYGPFNPQLVDILKSLSELNNLRGHKELADAYLLRARQIEEKLASETSPGTSSQSNDQILVDHQSRPANSESDATLPGQEKNPGKETNNRILPPAAEAEAVSEQIPALHDKRL